MWRVRTCTCDRWGRSGWRGWEQRRCELTNADAAAQTTQPGTRATPRQAGKAERAAYRSAAPAPRDRAHSPRRRARAPAQRAGRRTGRPRAPDHSMATATPLSARHDSVLFDRNGPLSAQAVHAAAAPSGGDGGSSDEWQLPAAPSPESTPCCRPCAPRAYEPASPAHAHRHCTLPSATVCACWIVRCRMAVAEGRRRWQRHTTKKRQRDGAALPDETGRASSVDGSRTTRRWRQRREARVWNARKAS